MDQKLDSNQLDLLVAAIESLPALPAVIARMVETAAPSVSSPSSGAAELIRLDVSLTARVLSLAARTGRPAMTADAAVAALDPDVLRSALLSTPALSDQPSSPDNGTFDHAGFALHCLAVANAARLFAPALHLEAEEAFTCGVLHDLGKLVLEQAFPKAYHRALELARIHNGDLAQFERTVLGVDHCHAGWRLAQRWQLAPAIRDAIWLHHQPLEAIPASVDRRMVCAIGLADALVRQQRIGFSGNYAFPRSLEQMARQASVPAELLDEIRSRLPAVLEEQAQTLGLGAVSGESIRRQALERANAELAILNDHLRRRAEQVESRARGFDLLHAFIARQRPEASVSDLLPQIAEMMAGAMPLAFLPARTLAVYSAPPGAEKILALLYEGPGLQWRIVPRRQALSGVTPADAVRQQLEEDLGDWLGGMPRRHMPLLCGDAAVGGVFLPAGEGTPDDPLVGPLADAAALALATVQGQNRAFVLNQELAGASQTLAQTQSALAEEQTLATIGEMAAGAAHEINNPLAVISGRAQLMREKADTPELRKVWQTIDEQARRISDIITGLMAFASPPPPRPESLPCRQLFEEAINSFKSSEHPQAQSARVDIHVQSDTPALWADRKQMCAVLAELICNAASAASGPARIVLAAEADDAGRTVLLTAHDDGPGMDEATQAGAFTPFFSSQKAGRRRGLGLPTVKRYVDINDGKIWIRSGKGHGTTVCLQLPSAP